MQRNVRDVLLAVVLCLLALPNPSHSQDCKLLCAPVFVLQPGLVTTNFLDAPAGAETESDFNFRVVTAIPTSIPRTTLVGIVQWTPLNHRVQRVGNRDVEISANSPGFVYGPVFNLLSTPLIGLDFDVLGAYGPAAQSDDEADYTHKLVLEGDLFLKAGSVMGMQGNWQNLALYGMLAYVATGIPDAASPWVLLTGLSLPIAPWP